MIRVAGSRGIKKRSHEKLTDVNIQHVMKLLNAESPITKKEACSILNISYNTTRLGTIIEDFVEKKDYRDRRKSENRGKPASKYEITNAIEAFLNGNNISDISKSMYRSPSFVKGIIERAGVPRKRSKEERGGAYVPYFLPDECVSDTFEAGDVVWSASYDQAAKVEHELTNMDYEKKYGAKCYCVYVFEQLEWNPDMLVRGWVGEQMVGFTAYQMAYDLGSLKHLESYGVDVARLQG